MRLLDFYGQECPHCLRMMPLLEKASAETDVDIEKIEVWHNQANAEKMEEFHGEIVQACGGAYGVPALVEPESRQVLCGEVPYQALHTWIEKVKESA